VQDFILVQLLHGMHQLNKLFPDFLFVEVVLRIAFVLDQLTQIAAVYKLED
jgi:hypothetical protein